MLDMNRRPSWISNQASQINASSSNVSRPASRQHMPTSQQNLMDQLLYPRQVTRSFSSALYPNNAVSQASFHQQNRLLNHLMGELPLRSELISRQTEQVSAAKAPSSSLAKKHRALIDLKGPQASNIVPVFRMTKAQPKKPPTGTSDTKSTTNFSGIKNNQNQQELVLTVPA